MKTSGSVDISLCPCGSGLSYLKCCQPYHLGKAARTAEALMRSRYSAYVLKLTPYLLDTWAPAHRPKELLLDTTPATKWLGLTVIRAEQSDARHAVVEFIARYRVGGGSAQHLHETSRFIQQEEDGRWYYFDGEHN